MYSHRICISSCNSWGSKTYCNPSSSGKSWRDK